MIRRKNLKGLNVNGTSILDGETQLSPNGGNVLFSWNTRYFASTGNFSIGSQADTGFKLNVNGSISVGNSSAISNRNGASLEFNGNILSLNASILNLNLAGALQSNVSFFTSNSLRAANEMTIGFPTLTVNDSSAILQLESTTRGVLFPRMTSAQRLAIATPKTGLIVYQTDAPEGIYTRKSTGWVQGV